MELTNEFRVALPVERAWAVLTDLELIAPCMPGAQLQEIEGDDFRGIVKIKVGPITAQYKGQATFLHRDDVTHVAVLRAEGRETRGQGNANATITASLTPDGDGTAVSVVTDLTVTGRVAQFGRGVLADVSAKLLDQFVQCLETTVLSEDAVAPAPPAPPAPSATPAEPEAPAAAAAPAPKAKPASKPKAKPAPKPAVTEVAEVAPSESLSDYPGAPEPVVAPSATPPVARRVDHPPAEPVDLISAAGSPVAKRVGPILAIVAVVWVLRKLLSRRRK